jgi:hypothetical protein
MKASITNLKKIERQIRKEFKTEFFLDTKRGIELVERWHRMVADLSKQGVEIDYDFNETLS